VPAIPEETVEILDKGEKSAYMLKDVTRQDDIEVPIGEANTLTLGDSFKVELVVGLVVEPAFRNRRHIEVHPCLVRG
jgi:hypothetical protein